MLCREAQQRSPAEELSRGVQQRNSAEELNRGAKRRSSAEELSRRARRRTSAEKLSRGAPRRTSAEELSRGAQQRSSTAALEIPEFTGSIFEFPKARLEPLFRKLHIWGIKTQVSESRTNNCVVCSVKFSYEGICMPNIYAFYLFGRIWRMNICN